MTESAARPSTPSVWPNPGLDAVLFDMDGTLVDSEKVWSVALSELAVHLGGSLSPAARAAMVGTSMTDSMLILHTDLGRPGLDVAESVVWLEDRMARQLFADGLDLAAGRPRTARRASTPRTCRWRWSPRPAGTWSTWPC